MKLICSINGEILPLSEAHISVDSIEVQYGFGVYETIKVRNRIIYFLDKHIERLFHSALCIQLEHVFSQKQIVRFVEEIVNELGEDSCNLKIILYGASLKEKSQVFLLPSAPLYPNRKWYKEGITLMSYKYERWMPQAKTLHMLTSYYLYKQAKAMGNYDALLINHNNEIIEGTRTNVYVIKGTTIYSPPEDRILTGVTLLTLKKVLSHYSQYRFIHKRIPFNTIHNYEGMFLTSTSSKILPVKAVDKYSYSEISPSILDLIKIYDEALEKSKGQYKLM